VLRTWRDINQNIETYEQAFGDNFIIVNNNPKDAETNFDEKEIKARFFDTSLAKGKPKTPEEIAKLKADKEELNNTIKLLIQKQPKFTSIEDAKSKIQAFTK
jgi:hypothetical protein